MTESELAKLADEAGPSWAAYGTTRADTVAVEKSVGEAQPQEPMKHSATRIRACRIFSRRGAAIRARGHGRTQVVVRGAASGELDPEALDASTLPF